MTDLLVPLAAVPSQQIGVQLGEQACKIAVYQKTTGLYLDLRVSDNPVVTGVLCLDRNKLVLDAYLGFVGDLAFVDTQGFSDPDYTGLGSRFVLAWRT